MFSFTAERYDILDGSIMYEVAQSKYPNKIMIVQNVHVKDKRIYGDIIAIMSVDEYEILRKPKKISLRFGIWEGDDLMVMKVERSYGVLC